MTPEQWGRVRDLYDRAVALPAGDRAGFVARTGAGDEPEVVRTVLEMLQVDEAAAEELLRPALQEAADGLIGHRIADRYRLVEEIGAGGMGTVFAAVREHDGQRVAVKVLTRLGSSRPRSVELFERELAAIARLDHPGIVKLLDSGRSEGLSYAVMEFVDGPSLRTVLDRSQAGVFDRAQAGAFDGPLDVRDPAACALLVARVLDALQHAHERGIIHRDVKPENILLTADGAPRLVDFGIARDLALDRLSRTGELTGTPHYMSPEQADHVRRPVDHRSDLFSAAAVLYELLTGRRPFEGDHLRQVLDQILFRDPPPIRRLNRGVPRGIAVVCRQALCKAPEHRFPSAIVFAQLLRDAARGMPVQVAGEPLRARVERALVRRPWLTAGTAVAVALVSLGAWFGRGAGAVAETAAFELRVAAGLRPCEVDLVRIPDDPGSPAVRDSVGRITEEVHSVVVHPGRLRIEVRTPRGTAELYRDAQPGPPQVVAVDDVGDDTSGMLRFDGGAHVLRLEGREGSLDIAVEVEPFLIDRRVVTNREFLDWARARQIAEILESPRWDVEKGLAARPDWYELPATYVTWAHARAFAESRGKRLPTLAEWEFAVSRDPALADLATLDEAAVAARFRVGRDSGAVHLGLYHEHVAAADDGADALCHPLGNVREWVETPYLEIEQGVVTPRRDLHVSKGFAWSARARDLAGSGVSREWFSYQAAVDVGFRCARSAAR